VRGAARDRLLAEADVLALPSLPVAGGRSEGAPVTALEAMAAGVPVVAARTGGLSELPAETALLVPPGDAAALAQALARCLTDPALRVRQVHAASRWVAQHDWSEVGAKLWALTAR
jgi:glycosyltransferase involved in cell wall biosynthesis